jgi:ornithine cyclodeaminase
MAASLHQRGLVAHPTSAEEGCRTADIIVTATASRAPLFDATWVRPGTHIASMGSDATGKQELPPPLFEPARLFCDLPSQSRVIGEFQHAPKAVVPIALGDVILCRHPGRQSRDDITIFDSSGLAIQDLYIGKRILDAAMLSTDPGLQPHTVP